MKQDKFNPELLQFVVLPGANPAPQYLDYYNKAYECWLNVWKDAFDELGLPRKLYSDNFTRQTEVDAIFYDGECVGMLFLNWIDCSLAALKNDSYFKLWTDLDFKKLTRDGDKILICSNTTISHKFRRSVCPISMKDLVFYFSCRRFKESAADGMTGVTRIAKGIHKLSYRFGAVEIRTNVVNYNQDDLVDICAFYKDTVSEGEDPEIIQLGRKLWSKMIVVERSITELPDDETKKIAS